MTEAVTVREESYTYPKVVAESCLEGLCTLVGVAEVEVNQGLKEQCLH